MAAQQYYPFGMLMPASTDSSLRRQYSLNDYDYRYGFNGKEGDDEIKGDDNQQDYGMRIYDPRVGRFLSVDPIAREYPWYTPYQFAGNKPIIAIDIDGLEEFIKPYMNRLNLKPNIGYAVIVVGTIGFEKVTADYVAKHSNGLVVGTNIVQRPPSGVLQYEIERIWVRGGQYACCNTEHSFSSITVPASIRPIDFLPVEMKEIIVAERKIDLKPVPITPPSPVKKPTIRTPQDPARNPAQPSAEQPHPVIPPTFTARNVDFKGNSNELINTHNGWNEIAQVVDILEKNPDIRVTVEAFLGYTGQPDAPIGRGREVHNYRPPNDLFTDFRTGRSFRGTVGDLMDLRAGRIKDILISRGIDESRIRTSRGGAYQGEASRNVQFYFYD